MLFFNCLSSRNKHSINDKITLVNWDLAFGNCQHDNDLMQELFGHMITGLAAHKIELLDPSKQKDHHKISQIAHRIKGDSATLACGNLSSHANTLQTHPSVKENLDNVIRSIDKTMEVINKRYG